MAESDGPDRGDLDDASIIPIRRRPAWRTWLRLTRSLTFWTIFLPAIVVIPTFASPIIAWLSLPTAKAKRTDGEGD